MARQESFEEAFTRFVEDFMVAEENYMYDKAIGEMPVKPTKSMVIDFTDLYAFDMELARIILDDPETLIDRDAENRQLGTLATVAIAAWNGADILRVHDVRETREVLTIVRAIKEAREQA